jgi:hypothetical protein
MKAKYGNTFNEGHEVIGSVSRVNLFPIVDEFYPVGCFVPVDETNTVGKKIPAGTPISVDVLGGAPTLGGTAPIGLTYEDAYVGTNGCTLTIVTRGQIQESLSEVTYTSTQKTALKGRILFIKEA